MLLAHFRQDCKIHAENMHSTESFRLREKPVYLECLLRYTAKTVRIEAD
jgi:hypothetical protein